MNNVGTSYILWALGLMGFAGVHRLYNRKFVTGFLWLFTGGLFGVGQFIDLFLIPGMVNEHNAWLMFRRTFQPNHQGSVADPFATQPTSAYTTTASEPFSSSSSAQPHTNRRDRLMLQLLQAAKERHGKLSVTQGVMDTGYSFSEVEATLREMVKTGYIAAHNDPVSGIVMFDFIELSREQPSTSSQVDVSTARQPYSDSVNSVARS